MSVLCKFKVWEIANHISYSSDECQTTVKLQAVKGEPFGKYTPNGTIQMTVMNPEAAKEFELGKEYLVEFRPA